MNTTLPLETYCKWYRFGKYEEEGITKFKVYRYKYKSLYIKYFSKLSKLQLEGKIIDLLPENKKIDNVDCLWIGTDNSNDLYNVIPIINQIIYELLWDFNY